MRAIDDQGGASDAAAERAGKACRAMSQTAALCGAQHDVAAGDHATEVQAGPWREEESSVRLTVKQSHAVQMMARGVNASEIAMRLGVNRATVFRWRQRSPAFERELRRLTRVSATELAGLARGMLLKATRLADRALDTDGGDHTWADRVLRNRKLWDLAMSPAAEADEAADDDLAARLPPAPDR